MCGTDPKTFQHKRKFAEISKSIFSRVVIEQSSERITSLLRFSKEYKSELFLWCLSYLEQIRSFLLKSVRNQHEVSWILTPQTATLKITLNWMMFSLLSECCAELLMRIFTVAKCSTLTLGISINIKLYQVTQISKFASMETVRWHLRTNSGWNSLTINLKLKQTLRRQLRCALMHFLLYSSLGYTIMSPWLNLFTFVVDSPSHLQLSLSFPPILLLFEAKRF